MPKNPIQGTDNFDFGLIGVEKEPFLGYISSKDKTDVSPRAIIRGSKNVYKKRSGTIASRPGLKRRGTADTTNAGIKSSYEWNTSLGAIRSLRVVDQTVLGNDARLQVEWNLVWYDLFIASTVLSPALSYTRFVFDTWWEQLEAKDRLVFVRGSGDLLHWSGGIAKTNGVSSANLGILTYVITNQGAGYRVGDILTVVGGGGTGGSIIITQAGGGAIGASVVSSAGSNYVVDATSLALTGGSGTGATLQIATVGTVYSLTKSDSSKTWAQEGFASLTVGEKRVMINGIEYTYSGGESTSVALTNFQTVVGGPIIPALIPADSVVIQSIIVQAAFDPTDPITGYNADFVKTIENQVVIGSYTARIMYLSADQTVSNVLGMTNFTDSGTHVTGDPGFIILDNPPTGCAIKDGKLWVSAGNADWYQLTLNYALPVSYGSPGVFVITKVDKRPGAVNSAAKAQEFIETVGDDIVYLSQDNQLRVIGTFRNIFGTKYPALSQPIYDDFYNEDFTGGHLRAIGDFIYITAPLNGRHWMYETRDNIDDQGNIISERIWHSPQISGISRFAVINGIVYGHSVSNPQIYQVWDTNQWYDDSPNLLEDGTYDQLPYTCVMRTPYRSHGRHQGVIGFDKIYFEGYISNGVQLDCNVYYDYQGSEDTQQVNINSIVSPATFFTTQVDIALGSASLGNNPLGDGLVVDPLEQELLPKFRAICDANQVNLYEYSLEIFSDAVNSRWEILCWGVNIQVQPQSATDIRK